MAFKYETNTNPSHSPSSALIGSGRASWKIKKSTLPWKEGKQLINPNDAHFLDSRSDDIPEILEVLGSKWKVYECSFTRRELEKMLYVGKSKSSTCTRSKL
mmetsp:Transcript_20992/g.33843  ORF Transcript_20992/g.33843 Transcript_20992/m.33843 type:complete len:101 (+) Transcript_20992:1048-1350(+)